MHDNSTDTSFLQLTNASKEDTKIDIQNKKVYCGVDKLSYSSVRKSVCGAVKEMKRYKVLCVDVDGVFKDAIVDGLLMSGFKYDYVRGVKDKRGYEFEDIINDKEESKFDNENNKFDKEESKFDKEDNNEKSRKAKFDNENNKFDKKDNNEMDTTEEESEEGVTVANADSIRARALNLARFFSLTPSNLMTPRLFSAYIKDVIEKLNLKIKMEECGVNEIKELEMNLFLSVAKGSAEDPRLVVLSYLGREGSEEEVDDLSVLNEINHRLNLNCPSSKREKESKKDYVENNNLRSFNTAKEILDDSNVYDLIMVGKGITFDSGGISLKPSKNMEDMKGDMMGAATMFSSLVAVAQLGLAVNVKVILPICENMPGGRASKPGDVVIARNGKSVEINNTDAEGRLILADALDLAHEFKTKMLITASTLTGACVVALGNEYYGVYCESDEMFERIKRAGERVHDRGWRMPLSKGYLKCMESSVADLKNCGYKAGSCTAAIFLKEFVRMKRFAHLDIAGMLGADSSGVFKEMSGRPCLMLVEFMRDLCD